MCRRIVVDEDMLDDALKGVAMRALEAAVRTSTEREASSRRAGDKRKPTGSSAVGETKMSIKRERKQDSQDGKANAQRATQPPYRAILSTLRTSAVGRPWPSL